MRNTCVAVALLGLSLAGTTAAQAWEPTSNDAQSGSVALAQYLNDHPYGIAKLANIAICFNSSASAADCKNTAKGIDPTVFSGNLASFNPAVPSVVIHLKAARIFTFGSVYNYEGDITVANNYSINGCGFNLTGVPTFTFENEKTSLNSMFVSAFHSQLTEQASDVMDSLLGGYQGLPGLLASCK